MKISMEYFVLLISALSGATVGSVFGFSMGGYTQIREGREFYPRNPIMRFFVTAPKDRKAIQNLVYFVLIVSWFFVFVGLVALPFTLNEKLGPFQAWVNTGLIVVFIVSLLFGKFVGRQLWYRYQ